MDMKDCPFGVSVTGMPKVMAGRDDEKSYFSSVVGGVLDPSNPRPAATVMFGPRGVGKTSMMRWLQKEVDALKNRGAGGVDALYFSRPDVLRLAMGERDAFRFRRPSLITRLRDAVMSRGALAPVSSEKGAAVRFAVPDFVDLMLHYKRTAAAPVPGGNDPVEKQPADVLVQRCRETPLLILLDEAHRMSLDTKKELAALAYDVASDRDAGFHLVFAGTPGVNRWRGFDEISFSERFHRLPIGSLDLDQSKMAIAEPFGWHETGIREDALDAIAADSNGYPTFIQMWGIGLWGAAEAPGATLTMDHVERARVNVDNLRAGFYGRRLARIRENPDEEVYLAAHYAAALAMAGKSWSLIGRDLERAVAAALPWRTPNKRRGAMKMLERLEDADFVWMPHDMYEPGIPSFMSYIVEYVRNHEPKMAASVERRLSREFPRDGLGM